MKAVGRWSVSSFLSGLLMAGIWGVLALIVAFACIIALSLFGATELPGAVIAIPAQARVDTQGYRVTAPSLGIDSVQIGELTGAMMLTFRPPSAAYAAAIAAGVIVPLAFALYFLSQLRAIFRTVRAGTPFVPENAGRIRKIAYSVIGGAVAQALMAYAWNYHVMTHFSTSGMRFEAEPDLDVFTVVGGLIILVLAEVFRAGTRLDEEQSLTV